MTRAKIAEVCHTPPPVTTPPTTSTTPPTTPPQTTPSTVTPQTPTTCTPPATQIADAACPTGQTGRITTTTTYTCPSTTGQPVAATSVSSTCTTPVTTTPSATTPTATYSWVTSEWTSCTNGQQTRTVQCKNSGGGVASDSQCTQTRPVGTQSCTPPSVEE